LFIVSDGTDQVSEPITITVGDVNRIPVLSQIGDKNILEGETLEFTITATDSDGDTLTFTTSNFPSGSTFDQTTRSFRWTPLFGDSGVYQNVLFKVDDGNDQDFETITITVGDINRPPVLAAIGNRQVDEGQTLTFTLSATDSDGNALTYFTSNLPTGSSFNAETGVFSWTPGSGSSGNYPNILFTVSDGTDQVSEPITITVGDVNRPPVLAPLGNKKVKEGEIVTFSLSATDPDNDKLTYSVSSILPIGATFDAVKRIFIWKPSSGVAGSYTLSFSVADNGQPSESDSVSMTIEVLEETTNCRDGSLPNQCSSSKPLFCTDNGDLVEKCSECGCVAGLQCNPDETCKQIIEPDLDSEKSLDKGIGGIFPKNATTVITEEGKPLDKEKMVREVTLKGDEIINFIPYIIISILVMLLITFFILRGKGIQGISKKKIGSGIPISKLNQLDDYIKIKLIVGHSKHYIKKGLIKAGWPKDLVRDGLKKVKKI